MLRQAERIGSPQPAIATLIAATYRVHGSAVVDRIEFDLRPTGIAVVNRRT